MPLKTETPEEPTLNLTPMIDVVFLLIIFFLVGARFTKNADEQQFDVDLPTAAPMQTLSREPDPLIITVRRNGQMTLGTAAVTADELKAGLVAAREAYSGQSVIIRGDGDGSYQSVVDVMSVCHKAQIRRFSLAFQPRDSGKSQTP